MLSGLPAGAGESVVVGMEHPDDAAVVRTPGGDLLVQTVDIIAPIVNDPAMFGRVACANALSDVYAMGGRPIAAMNVACFPADSLPVTVLRQVIDGALETLAEAGCPLVGGHTVVDPEFKFGFAVSGVIEGGEPLGIDRAVAGDLLVLTKPIGTGVVNQALRKGLIEDDAAAYLEAQRSMVTLNAPGARAARAAAAHAATDVTGFGLLGHAAGFARASHVTFEIEAAAVPRLPGVDALLQAGVRAGRAEANRAAYADRVLGVSPGDAPLLFDPQTSGGLLVALPPAHLDRFTGALEGWRLGARVIGRVLPPGGHDVVVR